MPDLISLPWPAVNEVHIHCVSFAAQTASRYISPAELLRANRLIDPRIRNRFIISRGLLREVLGRYLGMHQHEILIALGRHGKPYLSGQASNSARLHFNLSHSGSLFLLAIAVDREVGVDIEQLREDSPFSDLARLTFSPREQHDLFSLPLHLQLTAFFRCWTRKEAYMKACGTGFSVTSNSFNVSLLPESPVSLISPDGLASWLLYDICVPKEHFATLAVNGLSPVIRYFD